MYPFRLYWIHQTSQTQSHAAPPKKSELVPPNGQRMRPSWGSFLNLRLISDVPHNIDNCYTQQPPHPSILLTEQKFNRINIFISAVDANSKNEDKQITFVTDTATFTDHTNWYKKGPGKPANFRFQKSGERGRVSQVDGQVGEGGQVCPVTTCWEGKRCPTLACSCPALCGHFTFHWPIRSSLSPYLSLSIISTLKFPLLNLCMHLFCACSIVQEVHFTPTMKFVLVNYEQTQTWTPEHIWIRF